MTNKGALRERARITRVVCLEKRCQLMQGGDGGNVPHAAKTTFRCSECDGYLYILKEQNCFKKYHTQVQFWSDNQVNDNDSEDSDYL